MDPHKRIFFITTANLSSNPRMLKEVLLAQSLNYKTEILAFRLGGWSDKMDEELVKKWDLRVTYLSALRKPFLSWFIGSLVHWTSRRLGSCLRANIRITAYGVSKRSFQLIQHVKKMESHFELVIAHNPGALYPAWWYSKRHKVPFNFDVEDYHPGERVTRNHSTESGRNKFLMAKLLPEAHYVTCAAPLIRDKVKVDLRIDPMRLILIHNTFFKAEFVGRSNQEKSGKTRLVWFSQKISYFRGLEPIIQCLNEMKERFSLTLIGAMDPAFYAEYIKDNQDFITSLEPISQESLHRRLSEYDVGLAVEDATSDLNRDICLTNKIWAYYLSGLYILATDTRAQRDFLNTRPGHGKVFRQNSLEDIIMDISSHIEMIRVKREERQNRALKESFEAEIPKLETTWRI